MTEIKDKRTQPFNDIKTLSQVFGSKQRFIAIAFNRILICLITTFICILCLTFDKIFISLRLCFSLNLRQKFTKETKINTNMLTNKLQSEIAHRSIGSLNVRINKFINLLYISDKCVPLRNKPRSTIKKFQCWDDRFVNAVGLTWGWPFYTIYHATPTSL